MAITRHFLGWDGPLLPRAAAWLSQHHVSIVVVPTTRAGRRLRECLAERLAPDADWLPPQIVTSSQLLHLLAPPCEEAVASDEAYRWYAGSLLQSLPPDNPLAVQSEQTLTPWYAAEAMVSAIDTVRSNGLSVRQAVSQLGDQITRPERHLALADLEEELEALLKRDGLISRHAFRERITHSGQDLGQIALVGCPDMIPFLATCLKKYPNNIDSLIMAPSDFADGFDALGLVQPTFWQQQSSPVDDHQIWPLAHAQDQVDATLRLWERADQLAPDDCAIIVPNEQDLPDLRRGLQSAQVPHRYGPGTALPFTSVGRLISAWSELHRRPNVQSLLSLLRHPRWRQRLGDPLAKIINEHRAAPSRNLRDLAVSCALTKQIIEHLGLCENEQSLADWAPIISDQIASSYPQRLNADSNDGEALSALGSILHELAMTPRSVMGSLADAYELVTDLARKISIPESGHQTAVEMLGPLELLTEEATWLSICQVTEGNFPSTVNSDAYWPNNIRGILGLVDDAWRYARDHYILHAAVHSRPTEHVMLLVPRVGSDHSPLVPSRLVLQGPRRHIRARALFGSRVISKPPASRVQPHYRRFPAAVKKESSILRGQMNPYRFTKSTLRP